MTSHECFEQPWWHRLDVGIMITSLMLICAGRVAQYSTASATSLGVGASIPAYTAAARFASPLKRTVLKFVATIPGSIVLTLLCQINLAAIHLIMH